MTRRFPFSLFIFLLSQTLTFAFNPIQKNDTAIFEDVLKAIALKQSWDLDRVNLSKLEVRKVRFGTGKRYEFRIRLGKNYNFLFKFPDEVSSWNKVVNESGNFGDWVGEIRSTAKLDSFKLEGPFELRIAGDDWASLSLPLNRSYTGVKRIFVGEGITVEISGAQGVSRFQTLNVGLPVNGSFAKEKSEFWHFWHSSCMPLLPIHISGLVSLFAYNTQNPNSHIEASFLSEDTVRLLPEKCYSSYTYAKQAFPMDSISLRISRLEKVLRNLLGSRLDKSVSVGSINAECKASIIIHFRLEVERKIGSNESLKGTLAEWRTRPTVEQLWFEIMAKVEAETLKPLTIKKVRPLISVDTDAWSNLMSNISFTKLPPILVSPEALTLDVKW